MKIVCETIRKDEVLIREMKFGAPLVGYRIKEVRLDGKDLRHLAEVLDGGSQVQREHAMNYLSRLATKFRPEDLIDEQEQVV